MLRIVDLSVRFGALVAVDGVSLEINRSEVVALLGPNGAGKSSLLNAVSGFDANPLVEPIVTGAVYLGEERIDHLPAHRRALGGIGHSGEGSEKTIAGLTVEENLRLGALSLDRNAARRRIESMYSLFPRLAERRRQLAGTLSGGEQQMLAIGRTLMVLPRVLLLDEPALGLAPQVVRQVYESIGELVRAESLAVLLVEQSPARALALATRGYLMQAGRIVRSGTAEELGRAPEIAAAYL